MIDFIRKQGFKFTENDDLTNREFSHVSTTITQSELATTCDAVGYQEVQLYDLFLDNNSYNSSIMTEKMGAIVLDARSNGVFVSGQVANVLRSENGYNISLEFTIEDR